MTLRRIAQRPVARWLAWACTLVIPSITGNALVADVQTAQGSLDWYPHAFDSPYTYVLAVYVVLALPVIVTIERDHVEASAAQELLEAEYDTPVIKAFGERNASLIRAGKKADFERWDAVYRERYDPRFRRKAIKGFLGWPWWRGKNDEQGR